MVESVPPAAPAPQAYALSLGAGGGALDLIAFAAIFAVVLLLAYAAAKLFGKQARGRMKGSYMEVVDAVGLGQDAQLYIVKAGGGFFLLAKSGKSVAFMAELDSERMEEAIAQAPVGGSRLAAVFRMGGGSGGIGAGGSGGAGGIGGIGGMRRGFAERLAEALTRGRETGNGSVDADASHGGGANVPHGGGANKERLDDD